METLWAEVRDEGAFPFELILLWQVEHPARKKKGAGNPPRGVGAEPHRDWSVPLYGEHMQPAPSLLALSSLCLCQTSLICLEVCVVLGGFLYVYVCVCVCVCSGLQLPVSMATSTSPVWGFAVCGPSPASRALKGAAVLSAVPCCLQALGAAAETGRDGCRVLLPHHTQHRFCLFSTVGKSGERASYSTFGRDAGMPGLSQVRV